MKARNDMKRQREAGFSLVELMVVIVLIGLLAGVVTTQVWPILFGSKIKIAKTQIKSFEENVEMYRLHESRLPESLEDLVSGSESNPDGYLKEIPDDPWGQAYIYETTGGRGGFRIISLGPDMTEGTEDDITSEADRKN